MTEPNTEAVMELHESYPPGALLHAVMNHLSAAGLRPELRGEDARSALEAASDLIDLLGIEPEEDEGLSPYGRRPEATYRVFEQ